MPDIDERKKEGLNGSSNQDEPFNPLLEYLDKIKPQPNVEDEQRQKRLAKFNAFSQGLGLIASGIGAANGATVIPNENKVGLDAYNRYLDTRQKYKAETDAWQKDKFKTIAQGAQYKMAQKAKDAAEQKANEEWNRRDKINFDQENEIYGIKKKDDLLKTNDARLNSANVREKEHAFQLNRDRINRENSNKRAADAAAAKPKKADFEVNLEDGTTAGLSKASAMQIYNMVVSDPKIIDEYSDLIINEFSPAKLSSGDIMGLLNNKVVYNNPKYSALIRQQDEYKEKLPSVDQKVLKQTNAKTDIIAADKTLNKALKKARIKKELENINFIPEQIDAILKAYGL